MSHINTILEIVARDVLTRIVSGSRHRFVFDPETLVPHVEDTGLPYEIAMYPSIKYLLSHAAGCEHSTLSIRDVLGQRLLEVAEQHTGKPKKAVATFLADLERRQLDRFLAGGDDRRVKQRDARLRRQLDKLGCRLEKSRKRDPLSDTYQLYDVFKCGTSVLNFDAPRDLDRLERWVEALLTDQNIDRVPLVIQDGPERVIDVDVSLPPSG